MCVGMSVGMYRENEHELSAHIWVEKFLVQKSTQSLTTKIHPIIPANKQKRVGWSSLTKYWSISEVHGDSHHRCSGQQPTVAELSTSAMGFKEETYDGLSSYDRFLLDANCYKEHHRTLDLYPLLMPPPELHGERSCDTNMLVKPLKPFV